MGLGLLPGLIATAVLAAAPRDPLNRPERELTPRAKEIRVAPLNAVMPPGTDPLAFALSAIGLTPSDITFRTDLEPPDPFRRRIVDRCLTDPHALEREVTRAADALLAARAAPRLLLAEAFRLSDLDVPDPAPVAASLPGALAAPLAPLPARVRQAFARLIARHAAASQAVRGETARYSASDVAFLTKHVLDEDEGEREPEPEETERLLALGARADRAKLATHLLAVAEAAATLSAELDGVPPVVLAAVPTTRVSGPHGALVIAGAGDDTTGAGDALVVDLGGDDHHAPLDGPAPFGGVRVIVDVRGDDVYRTRGVPLGGAFGGIGVLWDSRGDDRYEATRTSFGGAVIGGALHVDLAGDDVYSVTRLGQGAALFGIGVCADLAGTDVYLARGSAQGYAGTGGVGLLVDHSGMDAYHVNGGQKDFRGEFYDSFGHGTALGIRNHASGGIAGLVDGGGNDTYHGDYWAQGVGYWYALGFLVDRGGADRYVAGRYAQGAGVHFALGALLDASGHDTYVATAVSQGTGYDYSAGLLRDRAGNDTYVAHDFSQGCGFANGYGTLREDGGADVYFSWQTDAQGFGHPLRGFGSVGVHLDLGGLDRYVPEGRNNTVLTRGSRGVLLDVPR